MEEKTQVSGYQGIWFDLGQRSSYGSKYSGGLGTYTAKHHPVALYAKGADTTYFVYGGTANPDTDHLLAMIGSFDHGSGTLSRPQIVHDKGGVNDPHDNPSLQMDESGHLWVFVSGRGQIRPGYRYRSRKPYSIESWELMAEEEFTYPQPWWMPGGGFFHCFTRYTAGRELYWNRSDPSGKHWSEPQKLAGFGGHYQLSSQDAEGRIITVFNWHPQGQVDRRTNLYFMQTLDRGETWTAMDGSLMELPLQNPDNRALIWDTAADGLRVYLKDIGFDEEGRPVVLVVTSQDFQAGPGGNPRWWTLLHWTGDDWKIHRITRSTHNYDMGSLYLESPRCWRLLAPTEPGPQHWGTGGEIACWLSFDQGMHWERNGLLTQNSKRNHSYVRRPLQAHPEFYAYWTDGNPDAFSESHLYYYNRVTNKVHSMPYQLQGS